MKYTAPGKPGSIVSVEGHYDNFIGGKWLPPASGKYRVDLSPATAQPICEVPHSTPEDIEHALDAAHAAAPTWGEASPAHRAEVLNAVADAIEAHREELAVAESWENGKPVRETLAADIPLAADHFRYFAAAARARESTTTEIDSQTIAYHFHEPLGVVGQIIPFNFPLLMAAWKLAPALAAGNASVLKPASPTPWSILKLAEIIGDILPPGVLNVVNGPGGEIGKALATNPRIAKVAFTGETVTGRLIMQYAAQNIIPVTLELGGKSPNIFFADVMAADDEFLDKAVEGLVLYAFNKGEVCTCPSRALIQESMYDEFIARCLKRIAAIRAAAREGQLLRRHRPRRGRRGPGRRAPRAHGGRVRGRVLLPADRAQGPQQDAGVPGGDLRAGAGRDDLLRRGGGAIDRQRHPLRPRRRRVDPRREPRLPDGQGHQSRPGLGQLLPPVSRGCRVRRVQGVRHRA